MGNLFTYEEKYYFDFNYKVNKRFQRKRGRIIIENDYFSNWANQMESLKETIKCNIENDFEAKEVELYNFRKANTNFEDDVDIDFYFEWTK